MKLPGEHNRHLIDDLFLQLIIANSCESAFNPLYTTKVEESSREKHMRRW